MLLLLALPACSVPAWRATRVDPPSWTSKNVVLTDHALVRLSRKLGNPVLIREEIYRMNTIGFVETLWQDLRYGARLLRLSPGFAIVAILSLALGIGANTAIFQLIDAVRLRSLPVPNPQELAEVRVANGNGGMGVSNGFNAEMTNPLWEQVRERQQAFSGVFAWGSDLIGMGQGNQARRVRGLWVSGEFFSVLGVPPIRGRLFGPADDRRGCGPAGVVIGYGLWQSEFGGQDSAVGSKMMIQNHPFEVIGVTPPAFFGLEVGQTFDIALPICTVSIWGRAIERRDIWWLTVMGRLKPGWTLAQASAHLNGISPGLFDATAPTGYEGTQERYRKLRLAAFPAGTGVSRLRRTYDTPLWLLLAITGLVLLIACANLANLMLARASAREREVAVRLALGASRGRLIRQLLSESLLLAVSGAALGAGLARLLSQGIVRFLSSEANSLQLDLSTDWRVLAFTAAAAILTCVVFGLAPALRSLRIEPGAAMKAGGRGLTAGRERFSFQRLLVVSQIAVSLVLLVGAVLFVRSFRNLVTFDPGFREKGILITFFDLTRLHLPAARGVSFQRELLERVRAIPQVEAAASTSNVPLNGASWTMGVRVAGRQGEQRGASKFTWVSPGYFRTMEIPLLAGRDFNASDTDTSHKVAVVNETFVRRFSAGENPIGEVMRTAAEPNYPVALYEIVGVVKDTKYAGLREDTQAIAFAPAPQHPNPGPWAAILIRSSAPLTEVVAAVKRDVGQLNPEIVMDFRVFQAQIREGLARERLMAALSGFFGVVAALLAGIGLYGVISYLVARRRNEIGIRMALGASRYQVVALIMREAALLLVIGVAVGMILSLAGATSAGALLFGLQPYDPLTLIASGALLAAIAALASYLPARRTSRLDPMIALRYE